MEQEEGWGGGWGARGAVEVGEMYAANADHNAADVGCRHSNDCNEIERP